MDKVIPLMDSLPVMRDHFVQFTKMFVKLHVHNTIVNITHNKIDHLRDPEYIY